MVRNLIFCLLAVTAAWPQNRSAASPANQPSPKVAPHEKDSATHPVITVTGVCAHKKNTPGAVATPCATVVTKQQFDTILDALGSAKQTIPPEMRRNLANSYVELLAFAQIAESAGTENDPRFAEVMRLVRIRTLADFYRRSQEEKLGTPSADEIQAAYNQNVGKYEEVKLSRILIPSHNPAAQNKDDWEKKAAQAAEAIRDRAARGEGLDKLQVEVYATLGLMNPPGTDLGLRRRGDLPPREAQQIFALPPGSVTNVEQQAAGYIVYKVESKQTVPLEQVKDGISHDIVRQKMSAVESEVMKGVHADFDDAYFGSPAPAPRAPNSNPSPQPPGGTNLEMPKE